MVSVKPAKQLSKHIISVQGARLRFQKTLLFDNLEFTLEGGLWTCLLGPSGVGKSSLLRVIAGLEILNAGTVSVPKDQKIAYMAQQDLLLPWLTVVENICIGARLRGLQPDTDKAQTMLTRVGLSDNATDLPSTLSGGMRQRVALARTLMEDRQIVLMDEPFSALDAITRLRLQALSFRLLAGCTVLLVTHDPLEALRLSDRILVMSGRPAHLELSATPATQPPRSVTDAAIQKLYGPLLAQLTEADSSETLESYPE